MLRKEAKSPFTRRARSLKVSGSQRIFKRESSPMGKMNVSTTTALGAAATAVASVRTGEAMGRAAGTMKPRVVVLVVATKARKRRMPIMLGLKRGGREEVCVWWRVEGRGVA